MFFVLQAGDSSSNGGVAGWIWPRLDPDRSKKLCLPIPKSHWSGSAGSLIPGSVQKCFYRNRAPLVAGMPSQEDILFGGKRLGGRSASASFAAGSDRGNHSSNHRGSLYQGCSYASRCISGCRFESIRIPILILGMQNWVQLNFMGRFSSQFKSLWINLSLDKQLIYMDIGNRCSILLSYGTDQRLAEVIFRLR